MSYFIKRGEKVHGPFTADQIKTAYKLEKLKPEDLLGGADVGPWKEMRSVFKFTADPSDSLKASGSGLAPDANVEQDPAIVIDELPSSDEVQGKAISTDRSLTVWDDVWDDVLPQQPVELNEDSGAQSKAASSALAAAQREVDRQDRAADPGVTPLKIAGAICWALGALLLTQIGCFGLLGVWPMTLLTKHYYENGDGLNALCFGIATVISGILAIVWFVFAYDYINKAAGAFWQAIFSTV
jgi:hypothetical protein